MSEVGVFTEFTEFYKHPCHSATESVREAIPKVISFCLVFSVAFPQGKAKVLILPRSFIHSERGLLATTIYVTPFLTWQ